MTDLFVATDDPRLFDTAATDQVERLKLVMAALRNPVGGCPWDLDQTHQSIAQYVIEEAFEVVDAMDHGAPEDFRDELGDLLLQVVFHSQMSREAGGFDINAVAKAVSDKMIRRHPHVFTEPGTAATGAQVKQIWEEIKAAERAEKAVRRAAAGIATKAPSVLDEVPTALPALTRSHKLQERAARVGFDHPTMELIYGKVEEELAEVKDAAANGSAQDIELECGDLLFVAAAVARRLGVDPETAFRKANEKFERRFRQVEEAVNGDVAGASLDALSQAWDDVKAAEKTGGSE